MKNFLKVSMLSLGLFMMSNFSQAESCESITGGIEGHCTYSYTDPVDDENFYCDTLNPLGQINCSVFEGPQ